MMKLKCVETGKTTKIVLGDKPWENDEILEIAANNLLVREIEHRDDFVCVSFDGLRSEICHALDGLTEHSGDYRSYEIINI